MALAGLLAAGRALFPAPEREEWGVLVGGLPERVFAGDAIHSVSYYVLKQTHEPIFRKDDGQNYHSKILKSWRRSLDSAEYEFCLREGLHFNPGQEFSSADFYSHIAKITAAYDPSASVAAAGACLSVRFPRQRRGYLGYLTLFENAPAVRNGESAEDGLGLFRVESISPDKVVLGRKERVGHGYNRIVFYKYKGPEDPRLQSRGVKDFNMIPLAHIPAWVESEYFSFNTAELKSVNLVINHPDRKVREAVYNCVSAEELRRVYFPQKKDYFNIRTMLPVGMPGAESGLPRQNCVDMGAGRRLGEPLIFADWSRENGEALRRLMREVEVRSGLRISVKDYTPEELDRTVLVSPHPYHLAVLVVDAVRPDDSAFFAPFCTDKRCFDYELPAAKEAYKKMHAEDDQDQKEVLAAEIAKTISREYAVLPLYQNVKKLYYPKEIKRLGVGKGFLQYPDVAAMRI